MAARTRARRPESGAAAVEFALVSVLLITILFGILQYGFYFWSRSSAVSATREAARSASVGDLVSCSEFSTFITEQIGAADGSSPVKATRTFFTVGGVTTTTPVIGDIMRVAVTFNTINLGFVPLPLPAGGVVTASVDSRLETLGSPTPVGVC